jgi:RNA recognition motif-containing protein
VEAGCLQGGNALSTKSLYVGNLAYNTTVEDLQTLFAPYGPVTDARVVESRGFGFVDVPAENAEDAINATNGTEFQGRALTVNEARPRAERSGGGGRGGYGGGGRRS